MSTTSREGPLRRRQRHGPGPWWRLRPTPGSGSRSSTPATSKVPRAGLPKGSRCVSPTGRAQAWAERVGELAAGGRRRRGTPRRCGPLRAGRPSGRRRRWWPATRRAARAAAALSPFGTGQGKRGRPGGLRPFPHRGPGSGGCPGAGFYRRARHPLVRPTTRRSWPPRAPVYACARRPSRTWRTGSGRPGAWRRRASPICLGSDSHALDRPLPGNAQPGVRRTHGHGRPGALGRPRAPGRRHRQWPQQPSGGQRRAPSRWALGRPGHRGPGLAPPGRRRPTITWSRWSRFRPVPPTSPTSSARAEVVVADGRHVMVDDVAAALRRSIRAIVEP